MRRIFIIFLVFASCIQPYDFSQDSFKKLLVVEGFVSDQVGDSKIVISYSGDFEARQFEMLSDAEVTVIENEIAEHPFVEADPGIYYPALEDFSAISGSTYRLRILTDGRLYESEPVALQPSLEIDSITLVTKTVYDSGDPQGYPVIELQLTTVVDEDASRYYRYNLEETWLYVATQSMNMKFYPEFIIDERRLPYDVTWDIDTFENITYCWRDAYSVGINTATSQGLSRNQLIHAPVFDISTNTDRLIYKYSALVKQYSIDELTYYFLNMMKEFSENQGALFDIQPGFVDGNMYCLSDETEDVIGIFYATAVSSKRIFLISRDLSYEIRSAAQLPYPDCVMEYLEIPFLGLNPIIDRLRVEALTFLRDSLMLDQGLKVGNLTYGSTEITDAVTLSYGWCIDCRALGTNVKPEWWGDIFY